MTISSFAKALAAGTALALAAAACGGGAETVTAAPAVDIAGSEAAAVADTDFADTRPGAGIAAAGGIPQSGAPCPADEGDSAVGSGAVKVALVSPDVMSMDVIGLGDLVFDTPEHIGQAYVNKVNSLGGINGNCFDFRYYEYGFTDPAADFGRICAEIPQSEPLVLLGLGLTEIIVQCATVPAQIPTIGLYSQFPDAVFDSAGGLLFADHGAVEFLVANSMEAAFASGHLTASDRIGLLYTEDDYAGAAMAVVDTEAARLGLPVAGSAGVPAEQEGTLMLVYLQSFAEAGGDLFGADEQRFEQALGGLPAALSEQAALLEQTDPAELLRQRRQIFLMAAEQFKARGVTAVVAAGDWNSVRSLMIVADLIDWTPKWIINDGHYNMLVLLDSPQAQGSNLVQVSARRAADDPLEGLDRGCLSLRNAEVVAEPFSHRFHTDAWSLLTSTCDYLDVVFGAMARVEGDLTREAFVAEITDTVYETSYGGLVRFDQDDPFGYDSFRLLSADYGCALNAWGCMRPISDWIPASAVPAVDGQAG